MSCACDYEPTKVYVKTMRKARKAHRRHECRREIGIGEQYERVFGVWGWHSATYKTCSRCIDLRNYTIANVPCLCWGHQNMIDACVETLREYQHELPGMLFAGLRLLVKINMVKIIQVTEV